MIRLLCIVLSTIFFAGAYEFIQIRQWFVFACIIANTYLKEDNLRVELLKAAGIQKLLMIRLMPKPLFTLFIKYVERRCIRLSKWESKYDKISEFITVYNSEYTLLLELIEAVRELE